MNVSALPGSTRQAGKTKTRSTRPTRCRLASGCSHHSPAPASRRRAGKLRHQRAAVSTRIGWSNMSDREEWEVLLDKLRAEFQLRKQELELLHSIDLRLLESERPLDETFSYIAARTQELLNSSHTDIFLRRGKFLESIYSSTPPAAGQRVPISGSLTGESYSEGIVLNVSDLTDQAYSDRYIPIEGYQGQTMRSLLAVPIRLHDTTVGVLNSESPRKGAFMSVHERVATGVAAQIAIAVQRIHIFDRAALFEYVDQLIFKSSGSQHVIQAALQRVIEALRDAEQVEMTGAQIMFRRGENELEIVHSTNPLDVGLAIDIDGSISGRAVRERKTIVVGDVSKDPDYRMLFGASIKSEIAVPIVFGYDNVAIGVLNVESEELNTFGDFYRIVLESFADKVRTLLAFTKLRSDVTGALELRQANDLLVAIGDQTSNMIHRINNTVGAMRVIIRELQDSQQDGSILSADYLNISLESLFKLAERTLEMPRQVTQFLGRESNTVDVNKCVEAVLLDTEIPDNVARDIQLGDNIPMLPLYCFDLVVQNILQNALDAMPGEGRLSVKTSLVFPPDPLVRGGYVQLMISDTGAGIPEDILPHVFELNFTTKGAKGEGLGLGLWWVRNFVKRANGHIAISSTVNVGSEVVVKLPVERSSALEGHNGD
jgi:signal transduction histidine kinase